MSDYERITRAITYITEHVEEQPSLDEVAAHVHLSPFHFQRLFGRWAGVTPKRFLQTLTVERAKRLLREETPVLEASARLGLSSGSRLHDHFVQLEAVTPGDFKRYGEGLRIDHGVHPTPFGEAFIALTERGICDLSFVDDGGAAAELEVLRRRWPLAELKEERETTRSTLDRIFSREVRDDRPLSLRVSGTNFQVRVWRALLQIEPGRVTSYGAIAKAIGRPRAAQAVGQAVGANPVAFLIPCHRVIQRSGELGGYRWGTLRKQAMHAWESAAS